MARKEFSLLDLVRSCPRSLPGVFCLILGVAQIDPLMVPSDADTNDSWMDYDIRWIMRRFLSLLICASLLATPLVSEGKRSRSTHFTPEEWPLLPTWCNYTRAGGEDEFNLSAEAKILVTKIGREGWSHLHHYCVALVNIFRSHNIGITEKERENWLKYAVGEIDYVLRNSPKNFILRSEILTKRGYVLIRLKRYAEAEKDLQTAIKEQPNYWPPYGYLADIYNEQNQIEKAKAILEHGLKISPNAKGLKDRLTKLKNQ